MATATLSARAVDGFAQSASYDQHRASYPEAAVDKLLAALALTGRPGARVLDLAAGTGKFTEHLARAEGQFHILAVEPHDAMRAVLAAKAMPNVTVRDGLATSIPCPTASMDAVIVAQAFHWFANPESLQELARVLEPGASLGLIWNIDDYNQTRSATPTTAWESKLKEVVWSLDDDEPRFRHDRWHDVFENQVKPTAVTATAAANPLFSLPLGRDEVKWTVWLPDKEALWNRYRTLSQLAVLQGEELEKHTALLLTGANQRVRAIFDEALAGDDVETNEKGEIAVHGTTFLAWTVRIP